MVSAVVTFRLEQELVHVLRAGILAALPQSRQPRSRWVEEEVHVGMTIPDMVVYSSFGVTAPNAVSLTVFDSTVLAEVLRAPGMTQADVATRLFARPETLASSLTRLERLRVVKRSGDGSLHCYRSAMHIAGLEVVAIEAKLSRWRKAVEQAISYREFADASYVALPRLTACPAVALECEAVGVGLISVHEDGYLKIRVRPRRRRPISPSRIWLAQRALKSAKGLSDRRPD